MTMAVLLMIRKASFSVLVATLVCISSLSNVVYAQTAEEQLTFNTTEQEQLYQKLIEELRCLVCQNQNIADSNADLAKDLRSRTYDMIMAGDSEAEIKQFMRERFGDFVLYAPPVDSKTWLLWFGPALVLLAALLFAIRLIMRNARHPIEDDENGEQL